MGLAGCGKFVKFSMIVANVLIFIGGVSVLGVGIWTCVDKTTFVEVVGSNLYLTAAYIMIVTGAIIAIISFLGCLGAWTENKCLLVTYFIILLLIFITLLVAGILGYVFKGELSNEVRKNMHRNIRNDFEGNSKMKEVLYKLQKELKCCGVNEKDDGEERNNVNAYKVWDNNNKDYKSDQKIPTGCCNMAMQSKFNSVDDCVRNPDIYAYKLDCYNAVKTAATDHAMVVGGVGVGIACVLTIIKPCIKHLRVSDAILRCASTVSGNTFRFSDLEIELAKEKTNVPDAGSLLFGHHFTDHMLEVEWTLKDGWGKPKISPFHNLTLHPAAKVLHYATELFEGMKAYRTKEDKIVLFRPDMNIKRLLTTAERTCLPAFSEDEFLKCLKKLISIDADWVPRSADASLYIRPTFIGIEPALGVTSSNVALLYVILGPVGPYFTVLTPVNLLADPNYVRAWPRGCGDKKMGANYAPTIAVQRWAQDRGFQQILWLFGPDHLLTEVGTMNIFMLFENSKGEKELVTPPLDGMILPGVVRKSLLDLCNKMDGIKVSERNIPMKEVISLQKNKKLLEIFGSGTACIVCPVGNIHYEGQDYEIPTLKRENPFCKQLLTALKDIQYGRVKHECNMKMLFYLLTFVLTFDLSIQNVIHSSSAFGDVEVSSYSRNERMRSAFDDVTSVLPVTSSHDVYTTSDYMSHQQSYNPISSAAFYDYSRDDINPSPTSSAVEGTGDAIYGSKIAFSSSYSEISSSSVQYEPEKQNQTAEAFDSSKIPIGSSYGVIDSSSIQYAPSEQTETVSALYGSDMAISSSRSSSVQYESEIPTLQTASALDSYKIAVSSSYREVDSSSFPYETAAADRSSNYSPYYAKTAVLNRTVEPTPFISSSYSDISVNFNNLFSSSFEIEETKTISTEFIDSSLPFDVISSVQLDEFSSIFPDPTHFTPTPISDLFYITSDSISESSVALPTNQNSYSSSIHIELEQSSPFTPPTPTPTIEPSPPLYHVTGTMFVSMAATINISETMELTESNEPTEAQLDIQVRGIITNNTCACSGQQPTKNHCPCEALMSVVSNRDMAPLKFFCQTIQDYFGSSFRTTCNVTYQQTEESQERVPFACICEVEFRPSLNPSKLECTCNDTIVSTPPPSHSCNCSTEPCQCHEIEIHPNVFIRYNCSCEENNQTVVNEGNFLNNFGCQQYDFADNMVQVFVNCSRRVVDEPSWTTISPEVSNSCPCKNMSFAGGEVIVLYNCTCKNGTDQVIETVTETSKSETQSCQCVEFSFFDGRVKFRVNCTCETKVESCTCQGIYVDGKHIVVCLNCSRDDSITTTTSTTTTTTVKPVGNAKCEPKCKKAELFNGQIAVHFNCTCQESTKVFYHESVSAIEESDSMFMQCPCQNRISESTRNLLKRHVTDDRNGSVLFCSCEMRDRKQSVTSTQGEVTVHVPTSERVKSTASTTKPTNETAIETITESFTDGILERYWIRTVLDKKLENISDSKLQMETKLANAYLVAFQRQHSINLGLRSKRQIKNNLSVTILHVRPFEHDTSQTEIIYAVKSDNQLIPAKNAVQLLKLLDKDKEMEKIMTAVFHESGLIREDSEHKNRTSAPLIVPLSRRSADQRPVRKKKSKKSDLEVRNPEIIVSTPSDSGKSDKSLIRIKESQKKKKVKRESPLPLDVHRMVDHYQLPEDVFDHVATPPTKLVRKKKKLAPVKDRRLNVANASSSGISSMGVSNLDVAAISGSMNPIPKPRKNKSSTKERNRLNYGDEDDEIDSMIRSRADRVCSAEFLIEDIRSELERFHKNIPTYR
uniref:Branched-chain-amino-acid aminotransferase n=1 Tax=Strigamia maritima TaxID=126957 RepID=T1JE10_STRMM